MSGKANVLIYLLCRDLRVSDNPILHHLASSDHGFTHLLPVYVFPAHQIEVSGFIKDSSKKSPYPEARSQVGGYWRCGPHRAKFIGEAVWKLKESFETLGSDLVLRVGRPGDVLQHLIEGLHGNQHTVGAVWMTSGEGVEEKRDEKDIAAVCQTFGADFMLWVDEKYFIDDRDLNFDNANDLPDVFTTYRKSVEPLREKPRAALPKPAESPLPDPPDPSVIPPQTSPFSIPENYADLEKALLAPIKNFLPDIPPFPEKVSSAHPFRGGEDAALERLEHLIQSGAVSAYQATRNGLLGTEFSTKLSAFLAQGCLTARQIHAILVGYEDGTDATYEQAKGYGEGENEGTAAIRFELLWRDYMRLCTRKFKHKLFRLGGFRDDEQQQPETSADGAGGLDQLQGQRRRPKWKSADPERAQPDQDPSPQEVGVILERFNTGTTGMGLIDAAQRELLHTGYTSNRARQNVAGFLAKHLEIDWRYGAEWYEMLLVDYDVSSNWANWQYVAGVGNDPRGEARIFNPVKQAWDYDQDGDYVRGWVPEVAGLERRESAFQAWTASAEELEAAGLAGHVMVTDPVKRIEFSVDGKPKSSKRPFIRRRGHGRRPGNAADHSATTQSGPAQVDGQCQGDGQQQQQEQQQQQQYAYSDQGYDNGHQGQGQGPRGRGRGRGNFRGGRYGSNRGGYGYRGRYGGPHGPPPVWGYPGGGGGSA